MLESALRVYYRFPIQRGKWRITKLLAGTFPALQDVRQRVPGGTIHIDLRQSSAHAFLAERQVEPEVQNVMRQQVSAGDVVYDIGAHWGLHSVFMASLGATVIAFEPCPGVLPRLRNTVAGNDQIRLLEVALSDADGVADLFVPEDGSQSSLHDWTASGSSRPCELRQLDHISLPAPRFIKCDVEGAELKVFQGARQTITQHRPRILFEVNPKAMAAFGLLPQSVFDLLRACADYRFYSVETDGTLVAVSTAPDRMANILAIPSE